MPTKTKRGNLPKDLIDISTAGALVFVSRKTIANWLSYGKLRRFKAGGRTLVSRGELLSLIKEV